MNKSHEEGIHKSQPLLDLTFLTVLYLFTTKILINLCICHRPSYRPFHKLSWLSIIAALMSFGYASIGAGLSIATVIQG